jgi:hypothetical protein
MSDRDCDLGPCCICEGTRGVINILMLDQRSPIPGRGWACFQCGASADGAIAVVCRRCEKRYGQAMFQHLRFACKGYPGSDGRVPIGELAGEHRHDMSKHPGEG